MHIFGDRISGGLGHNVYADPDNPHVLVKVPTAFRRLLEAGYQETAEDIAFCQEHFAEWIPPTSIAEDEEHSYRITQARLLEPQHVSAKVLHEQSHLQEQMHLLLDQNACVLSRHGKSLDLYGFAGLCQSLGHSVARRLRLVAGLQAPEQKPLLANVLAGRLVGDLQPSIKAVDLSLFHQNQGKLLERVRSFVLIRLHRAMLARQFGMVL